jgi:hypothetical protein
LTREIKEIVVVLDIPDQEELKVLVFIFCLLKITMQPLLLFLLQK